MRFPISGVNVFSAAGALFMFGSAEVHKYGGRND